MPIPKPIAISETIEVWCADYREVMLDLGRDFAHIITDPPYEQRTHNAPRITRTDGHASPESIPFQGIDLMRADFLQRVKLRCSGWLIAFCTPEGVAAWRDAIEAAKLRYKLACVWVKPDAMPKFNGQGPSHGHECLVTAWCGPGYSRWNGGGRRGVFTHPCNPKSRDGLHPTEKPVALMLELVELFTRPGDLVLDPFMGTGATGIACARTGRRFIGLEQDPAYFQRACERLMATAAQADLFTPAPPPLRQLTFAETWQK